MLLRNAILIATIAAVAAGQSPAWSPPVVGYFYDGPSNVIRVVSGVPGSASVEGSVPSAVKIRAAFVAAGRRFAIAQTIDEGSVLLDWSSGEVTTREMPSGVSDVTGVVFSSRATEAAVASKNSGRVQIWRGLPNHPAVEREVALSAEIIALSDDGQLAWIEPDGVYTLDGDTPALLAAGNFSSIAFRPGTRELAAAARHNDTLVTLHNAGGVVSSTTLASSEDGIAEPVGLQFSGDGKRLIAANSRGRSATVLDLAQRRAISIGCDCDPTLVAPAEGNAVFRMTSQTDVPLVYLDAGSVEPRIFHVPVPGVSR